MASLVRRGRANNVLYRNSVRDAGKSALWKSVRCIAISSCDVAVIGAGITGLNIAYQLKRRAPEARVTVLEAGASLGKGSTGYSTGFQRAYYSQEETMRFALVGIGAYKRWSEYTGLGPAATAAFVETGALWMLGSSVSSNEAMRRRLAKFGVGSRLLGPTALAKDFPLINPKPFPEFDVEGGEVLKDWGEFSALFEEGAGYVDPAACLRDMMAACRAAGVDVRMNSAVTSVDTAGGRVRSVTVNGAETLPCGVAVNVAGPWCNKVCAAAGVALPATLVPIRVHIGHKTIPGAATAAAGASGSAAAGVAGSAAAGSGRGGTGSGGGGGGGNSDCGGGPDDFMSLPFVADGWGASGIYFVPRRESCQIVFGSVDARFEEEAVDPDTCDPAMDPDFRQEFLNCLHWRLPTLPTAGAVRGFASMYTVNEDDVHPCIGELEVEGLHVSVGFSGHGFKLAPAVGSLAAQQITGRVLLDDPFESTTPLDYFAPARAPIAVAAHSVFA